MTELIEHVCAIAKKAGEAILEVYNSDTFAADIGVETKTDDDGVESPLTKADKAAHNIIAPALAELTPEVPIMSEEGAEAPYAERKEWDAFWCVDPLDGTKEFIKRGGDFTVNIALVENRVPVLGVIYVPVSGELYYAVKDKAYLQTSDGKVQELFGPKEPTGKIVASKSHLDDVTKALISEKGAEIVSIGSSLKFCLVAKGEADAYIRAGPTMEWDTAAGHAIVTAVGLSVKVFGTGADFL